MDAIPAIVDQQRFLGLPARQLLTLATSYVTSKPVTHHSARDSTITTASLQLWMATEYLPRLAVYNYACK